MTRVLSPSHAHWPHIPEQAVSREEVLCLGSCKSPGTSSAVRTRVFTGVFDSGDRKPRPSSKLQMQLTWGLLEVKFKLQMKDPSPGRSRTGTGRVCGWVAGQVCHWAAKVRVWFLHPANPVLALLSPVFSAKRKSLLTD